MKFKKTTILIILTCSIIFAYGCNQEEETPYNSNIIVDDGLVLPYYETTILDTVEVIESKLMLLFEMEELNSSEKLELIVVNDDGENLTEEFIKEENPTFEDISKMAQTIEENGYHIVNKDTYRVTTVEKEIKALFAGERKVFPFNLDKIVEDNQEAFKNEDYEAINLYLVENRIMILDNIGE